MGFSRLETIVVIQSNKDYEYDKKGHFPQLGFGLYIYIGVVLLRLVVVVPKIGWCRNGLFGPDDGAIVGTVVTAEGTT